MRSLQVLKLVLIVAILVAVYQLIHRQGRPAYGVQPYQFERFEQGDAEYSHGSHGDDDMEHSDDDMEYSDGDDDEEVENFANAALPTDWTPSNGPAWNVATDLLPKPTYDSQNFAEFAPKSLLGQNFLDPKKYIGVDTQGSSLRNANYDLRSNPTIPRVNVGPWQQSTIDSDLYRKPLE